MKKLLSLGLLVSLFALSSQAAVEPNAAQQEYENSIDAIVLRNKEYYKAGSLELTGDVGVMPYNSLINTVMVGGRLAWHLSDHYGWEIADVQATFPSVTSFTTDTVTNNGLSTLQTPEIKGLLGSNFLLSPLYGKIRFIGRMVLHYDIYAVLGGGVANVSTLNFTSTKAGAPAVQSTLSTSLDPMVDFGLGVKIFLNRAMGLVIDLRDYVVYASTYGSSSFGSNYSLFVGLSFFLPPM